jgi:hypothetical protein
VQYSNLLMYTFQTRRSSLATVASLLVLSLCLYFWIRCREAVVASTERSDHVRRLLSQLLDNDADAQVEAAGPALAPLAARPVSQRVRPAVGAGALGASHAVGSHAGAAAGAPFPANSNSPYVSLVLTWREGAWRPVPPNLLVEG